MRSVTTTSAIAAIGLVCVAFASPASAWHFKPVGSFTANGSVTVTAAAVSLPCTAALQGVSTSAGAKITSATFSGISCAALTASGLPWNLSTHSVTGIHFHHVIVSAVTLGVCGPGDVKGHDFSGGGITISGAGLPGLVPCSLSGTLRTSPALKILPH